MTTLHSDMARLVTTSLVCVLALSGCSEPEAHQATFRVGLATEALRARAELVRAEIREGDCSGKTLFSTDIARTGAGAEPPLLDPGRYALWARARDASCMWFAEGCTLIDLPLDDAVGVVLEAIADEPDPKCVPDDETETKDPISAGDAGADADVPVPQAPPIDPEAPKCASPDESVVACYDFDGALTDATRFLNHATGMVSYEPAISGQAVRINGRTVRVEDAPSLNTDAFSIELWLRPDGLVNLSGQTFDISLLVDKDQQYFVGFFADGATEMTVYRGTEDALGSLCLSGGLRAGTWTYLAFTYDGARASTYRDGVLIESDLLGIKVNKNAKSPMHIGSGSPSTTRPFNGLIDALRISNRGLREEEVCREAGRKFVKGACL